MQPGIHTNISIQDYHADKSWISATGLKHAARSLAEYKYYLDGGLDSDSKPHFDFGNAFELALLDHAAFEASVSIAQTEIWKAIAKEEKPDLKQPALSKSYQDAKKAHESALNGRYSISDVGKHSYETIEAMMESCMRDEWIQKLINNIQYQNTLCWIDEKSGLQMKARPDIAKVNKNILVNLKTTLDASPASFSRDMANNDYPLQAVVEMEGAIRTGLMPEVYRYFWLVVEKEPPFCAVLYSFDNSEWDQYKRAMHFLLDRIKKGYETNKWPGYTDRADNEHGILTARIPAYYQIYAT